MYKDGQGVPQNDKEAIKWYQKSADQGHAKAQFNLGVMYENGQCVPQSDKEAVKWYQKAADQGLAIAQFNLGVMYGNARGVTQSNKQAVKWYQKAAEQGIANAQLSLGAMLAIGRGVPQSDKEAVQKAADQGLAEAQQSLELLKPMIHSKEAASVNSSELPSSTSTGCANCGDVAPTLRTCSRCKVVSYCSKECQVAHWKLGHKVACGHHKH